MVGRFGSNLDAYQISVSGLTRALTLGEHLGSDWYRQMFSWNGNNRDLENPSIAQSRISSNQFADMPPLGNCHLEYVDRVLSPVKPWK